MIKEEHYNNPEERENIYKEYKKLNYRLIHDTFDSDWKRGDVQHGTLTFTNEPTAQAPEPEPGMDYKVEILKLKAEIDKLKRIK